MALVDPKRAFRRTAKSCQFIGDLPAIQRNYHVVKADLSIVLAAIVTAKDDYVRWEYLIPRGRIGDRLYGGNFMYGPEESISQAAASSSALRRSPYSAMSFVQVYSVI